MKQARLASSCISNDQEFKQKIVGLGHGRLRHLGSGSASRGAPLRLRRAGGREAGESAAPRWGTRGAAERRREGPAVPAATAGPQLLRPRRTAGSAQAHAATYD